MQNQKIEYLGKEANETVKTFVASIKEKLKGARLKVQGTECFTLKQFGKLILDRDGLEILNAEFYVGFVNFNTCRRMTIKEILEAMQTKEIKFFRVAYYGSGCWGK